MLHITLEAKDPAHCPLLISTELCTSYSHLHHIDTLSSPDPEKRTLNFDLYQNAVASTMWFILKKMKWSKKKEGDASECIKKLLNLFAQQLNRFCEEASQVRS